MSTEINNKNSSALPIK